jgi:hypothetical protein
MKNEDKKIPHPIPLPQGEGKGEGLKIVRDKFSELYG